MFLVFVVVGSIFVLLTCAYQVRITEAALVSTLGKPGEPITEPGLHLKAPWPFQRAYLFDRRTQLFNSSYREVLTRNGANIVVKLFAAWSIDNPALFYDKVGYQTADGARILASLVEKHSSDVIGKHPLADFVSVQATGKGRLHEIEDAIKTRMAAEAANYGMQIRTVGLDHLELPASITKAVFNRMAADRERLTEKIRAEGEREAKGIRTEVDQKKAERLSEAEAQASTIRGEGDSEAYKNFNAFRKDPEFAIFLRKLEALEETLKKKTTLILDRDIPPFDLLKPGALGELPAPQAGDKTP
jgi:membrane protease subunit HflC